MLLYLSYRVVVCDLGYDRNTLDIGQDQYVILSRLSIMSLWLRLICEKYGK